MVFSDCLKMGVFQALKGHPKCFKTLQNKQTWFGDKKAIWGPLIGVFFLLVVLGKLDSKLINE